MNINVIEPLGVPQQDLQQLLSFEGCRLTLWPDRKEDEESLIERCHNADIIVVSNIKMTASVLEKCPDLKYICVAFTGTDHIDLDYCRSHGIHVSNCSGYSNASVSNLVFAMILELYTHLHESDVTIHQSGKRTGFVGQELEGKTFGIVGMGKIGRYVANIAQAFGCRIIYCSNTDKNIPDMRRTSLSELMAESDIISLHVPANASTHHLISAEMIALMKKDAILINCARGPVVDSDALARALNSGAIAGAGIDVYESEPPISTDHPLLKARNCLCTAHIGFLSKQSMVKRSLIVRDNISAFLKGEIINKII